MKVVGLIQKKGTFEGRDYNNLMIHCTYIDRANSSAVGELTTALKVKVANIDAVFGRKMSDKDIDALIGKEIAAYYNRFGVVDRIEILG